MKVCLMSSIYHPYYRGGGEHSVRKLAIGLKKRGIEVFVITAFTKNEIEFIDGIKVYRVKSPNIYWSFNSTKKNLFSKIIWHLIDGFNPRVKSRLIPIIKEETPDIIHIRNHGDFSSYLWKLIEKEMKIPVIITLNSYALLCPKANMFKNGKNCKIQCTGCKTISFPKKILSQYVSGVIGVSSFTLKKHLDRKYFSKAIHTNIYTSLKFAHRKIPFSDNNFLTFGYIGRVHPTKGILNIIDIFNDLPKKTKFKLLIAGSGPEEYITSCKERAIDNKNIVFLGQVKSQNFYDIIDYTIISSEWHEPFPRVLVESYSYGTPVLASSTGGTKEMIIEESTGFVYNDNKDLKEYVLRLLDKPDDVVKFSDNCVDYINRWSDEVDGHLLFYSKVLEYN